MANNGVIDDIETEDLDIEPRKQPSNINESMEDEIIRKLQSQKRQISPQYKRQEIHNFNNNKTTKEFGVRAIGRKTYIFMWILIIILALLLTLHVFWYNINVSSGKFKSNISVVNNMPTIPINITSSDTQNFENNFTINLENKNNITIVLDVNDQLGALVDDIVDGIIDELNLTNST